MQIYMAARLLLSSPRQAAPAYPPRMASSIDLSRYGFQPSQSSRSQWRDLDEFGQIHALPNSHGKAIATNGILVIVQRQQDYIIGHYDSWIPLKEPKEPHVAKPRKPCKAKVVEIEFL
mgnify:CR=1 FL=1